MRNILNFSIGFTLLAKLQLLYYYLTQSSIFPNFLPLKHFIENKIFLSFKSYTNDREYAVFGSSVLALKLTSLVVISVYVVSNSLGVGS